MVVCYTTIQIAYNVLLHDITLLTAKIISYYDQFLPCYAPKKIKVTQCLKFKSKETNESLVQSEQLNIITLTVIGATQSQFYRSKLAVVSLSFSVDSLTLWIVSWLILAVPRCLFGTNTIDIFQRDKARILI